MKTLATKTISLLSILAFSCTPANEKIPNHFTSTTITEGLRIAREYSGPGTNGFVNYDEAGALDIYVMGPSFGYIMPSEKRRPKQQSWIKVEKQDILEKLTTQKNTP